MQSDSWKWEPELTVAPFQKAGFVVAHYPLLMQRKNLVQVIARIRQKRDAGLLRRDPKVLVVPSDPMLPYKLVGLGHAPDLSQAQLLRQSSLPSPNDTTPNATCSILSVLLACGLDALGGIRHGNCGLRFDWVHRK